MEELWDDIDYELMPLFSYEFKWEGTGWNLYESITDNKAGIFPYPIYKWA